MIPKEKAKYLVDKFKGFEMPNEKIATKQCAIICINEMIEISDDYKEQRYLQEVKKEIELL